ncbi:MAG: AtpZ/AtpI family protein [Polyangiaceae bacterium]
MKNAKDLSQAGRFGTVGMEIVLSILLGLWIGSKLDDWLGTSPWMAVLWFGFGCVAAGRAVHRTWKDMQAAAKREEAEQGNPTPAFPDEKSLAWKREEERERKRRLDSEASERPEGEEDSAAEEAPDRVPVEGAPGKDSEDESDSSPEKHDG